MKWETEKYICYLFEISESETLFNFVKRVLEFASKQRTYDITYTKFSLMSGYVITVRYPEVIFFTDGKKALVWWWKSLEKFPEKWENGKEKKKEKREDNTGFIFQYTTATPSSDKGASSKDKV